MLRCSMRSEESIRVDHRRRLRSKPAMKAGPIRLGSLAIQLVPSNWATYS